MSVIDIKDYNRFSITATLGGIQSAGRSDTRDQVHDGVFRDREVEW